MALRVLLLAAATTLVLGVSQAAMDASAGDLFVEGAKANEALTNDHVLGHLERSLLGPMAKAHTGANCDEVEARGEPLPADCPKPPATTAPRNKQTTAARCTGKECQKQMPVFGPMTHEAFVRLVQKKRANAQLPKDATAAAKPTEATAEPVAEVDAAKMAAEEAPKDVLKALLPKSGLEEQLHAFMRDDTFMEVAADRPSMSRPVRASNIPLPSMAAAGSPQRNPNERPLPKADFEMKVDVAASPSPSWAADEKQLTDDGVAPPPPTAEQMREAMIAAMKSTQKRGAASGSRMSPLPNTGRKATEAPKCTGQQCSSANTQQQQQPAAFVESPAPQGAEKVALAKAEYVESPAPQPTQEQAVKVNAASMPAMAPSVEQVLRQTGAAIKRDGEEPAKPASSKKGSKARTQQQQRIAAAKAAAEAMAAKAASSNPATSQATQAKPAASIKGVQRTSLAALIVRGVALSAASAIILFAAAALVPVPKTLTASGPVMHAWRRVRRAYLTACRQITGHESVLCVSEHEGTPFARFVEAAGTFVHTFWHSLVGQSLAAARRLSVGTDGSCADSVAVLDSIATRTGLPVVDTAAARHMRRRM